MTWFRLSGGSLAETDTQKTSVTLKSSTKCNSPFQTRSSRVGQRKYLTFDFFCVPDWRRSFSVVQPQISWGLFVVFGTGGVSEVVGGKTGCMQNPWQLKGLRPPFIASEEIPACSRVQIASFRVNRQQSHSYHYSLFFFLSKSTLIALITLNCPPRSVDPSLPVICL